MANCVFLMLNKKGTIVIEVQYLLNTLQDLTFDNIYHEHYNYWSLTSLINFFNQFGATIFKVEKIDTHGGSIRIYIKKEKVGSSNFSSSRTINPNKEKHGQKDSLKPNIKQEKIQNNEHENNQSLQNKESHPVKLNA